MGQGKGYIAELMRALDGTLSLIDDDSNTRQTSRGRRYHRAVDAGGGLLVRRRVGYRYEPSGPDDEVPYEIETWAEYHQDTGTYRIKDTRLRAIEGGPDVSTDTLRVVPLATLLASLGAKVVLRWPEPLTGMPEPRLPRGALDERSLIEVGIVHRLYDTIGNRSTAMVAEHYGVSRSTAQKWIREARDRDLIAPVDDTEEVEERKD